MTRLNRYIEAATRENTRKSYRAGVEHYEAVWGGFLPATSDSIARYLVDHAESLSLNTLRQRLAALATWHNEQGFPDPTKASVVKKVLKGIAELHPAKETRRAEMVFRVIDTDDRLHPNPQGGPLPKPEFSESSLRVEIDATGTGGDRLAQASIPCGELL